MATARQIAANRRNARKSTGPKSSKGKQRASGNAYRHGLSIANPKRESETVEWLAGDIAGSSTAGDILYYAKIAARAHLTLARIRQVKVEIAERAHRFGSLKPTPRFRCGSAEIRYLKTQPIDRALRWPKPVDPLGPMPSEEPDRTAEAIKRILPELRRLYRYERRMITMRDEALREICLRRKLRRQVRFCKTNPMAPLKQ